MSRRPHHSRPSASSWTTSTMPSPVASSSGSNRSSAPEPLYQVKLLAALRSGDPALIQPILTEISRDRGKSLDGSVDLGAAALHLAIRCASYETVQLLLQNRSISPNAAHPPESKTSALHLAASLGRADVVSLLLEQEGIDDTLRDAKGRTPKDVTRSKEVREILEDSQSIYRASFISLLRTYIFSPREAAAPPALMEMLSSPRSNLLDLSYVDDSSGTTLLHEAARRKDLVLIELAIRAGADVFVRDRRGRPVSDAAGKDDRVKAYLRQYTNRDQTLIDASSTTEPPLLKGYLNKYTNVARGYNTRWFVLKDGMLSYYRNQDDENLTCRGSISMTSVSLKVSNSDKLRFEVHAVATNRSPHHHANGQPASNSVGQKWYMKANHPAEAARWTQAIRKCIEWYQSNPQTPTQIGVAAELLMRNGSVSVADLISVRSHKSKKRSMSAASSGEGGFDMHARMDGDQEGQAMADQNETRSIAPSSTSSGPPVPPHNGTVDLQANTAAAQLELTTNLVASFNLPSSVPQQLRDIEAALKDSIKQAQQVTNEYIRMTKEREQWYKEQLDKEQERNSAWEESLSVVVREGELLENELRKRGRARAKRRSMLFVPSDQTPTTSSTVRKPTRDLPPLPPIVDTLTTVNQTPIPPPIAVLHQGTSIPVVPMSSLSPTDDSESDEEDEFFDALEAGDLPNLVVSDTLKSPTTKSIASTLRVAQVPEDTKPYAGYSHLRDRLPIKSDDRPSTSLWQVLKGSIGKDLTKISFPVYFNEPTSMLQRMAEDMEFSECLDAAIAEVDDQLRIAYVAAFAMSNYSSTIGRIAKPFNPMLGETFEYVRLDKSYRYYSEQVSHHPPISACWAEGQDWRYYGEVDAQNKFMGKSFEIRPTGIAHAELKIRGGGDKGEDVYEHYTWKKVTTNVSGFILGNTTIDHYGEMKIINHRTKDSCILTFKPRTWRGANAFEISGHVFNAAGQITYHIAGRWDSQLVARKAEVGHTQPNVHPNVNINDPVSPSAPQYILLWRNTEKPKAPFNLTPFAVTLNDCPDDLEPFLPYTDCRLRPDQRAFELGRYDRANLLKSKQEDFQRATRKKREVGQLPPHKPRWFEARTDGDTGDRVWTPIRNGDRVQYWEEREKVYYTNGEKGWTNVERIFIEDEP